MSTVNEDFYSAVDVIGQMHKKGVSHLAFDRLLPEPELLEYLGESLIDWPDSYPRQIACSTLGYLNHTDSLRFETYLERELTRLNGNALALASEQLRQLPTADHLELLFVQASVEALAFSAIRIIRHQRGVEVGLDFLERLVRDFIAGERRWNFSSYAISELVHIDSLGYAPLFADWRSIVEKLEAGSQESTFLQLVLSGNTDTMHKHQEREETDSGSMTLNDKQAEFLDNLPKVMRETFTAPSPGH